MKIDATPGFSAIKRTNSVSGSAKTAPASAERAGKTDIIDFSRGSAPAPDNSISDLTAMKSSLMRDISANTDAARLQELQARVRDGSYRLSTDDLVKALMDDTF